MKQKPVAWMVCNVLFYFESYAEKMAKENNEKVIPLYTEPQYSEYDQEIKILEKKLIDFATRIKELENLVTLQRKKTEQAFAMGCKHATRKHGVKNDTK